MIGCGTLVNAGAIVLGGLIGLLAGKRLTERYQKTVVSGLALAVMFVGVSGTLQEMLQADASGHLCSHGTLMLVISLVLGGVIGEFLDIDARLESIGEKLRQLTGSKDDAAFVNAFMTATLTFCIGAMAIVGSIEDGMKGNPSILYLKAVMDGVFTIVLTASLGKGALFSVFPVAVYQGAITVFARFVAPYLTPETMSNVSYVGNLLIFAVGWNLIHGEKKIRVANLLPSLLIAFFAR